MPYGSGSTNHFGTSGADTIVGGNGVDFINGGPGDDVLSGGRGPDVFWSSSNFGHDQITDFNTHGKNPDILVFDGFGLTFISGFTTDTGHTLTITDTGNDTLLTWDTGDSLTLQGVDPGDLTASMIVLQGHSYGGDWI